MDAAFGDMADGFTVTGHDSVILTAHDFDLHTFVNRESASTVQLMIAILFTKIPPHTEASLV